MDEKHKKTVSDLHDWIEWINSQEDIPEHKKVFLRKHPFMAPKGWRKDLEKMRGEIQ